MSSALVYEPKFGDLTIQRVALLWCKWYREQLEQPTPRNNTRKKSLANREIRSQNEKIWNNRIRVKKGTAMGVWGCPFQYMQLEMCNENCFIYNAVGKNSKTKTYEDKWVEEKFGKLEKKGNKTLHWTLHTEEGFMKQKWMEENVRAREKKE